MKGGVAIYMKKDRKVTEKSEYKIQSSDNAKIENLWCEITEGTKGYIVGTVHRHPNQDVKYSTNIK